MWSPAAITEVRCLITSACEHPGGVIAALDTVATLRTRNQDLGTAVWAMPFNFMADLNTGSYSMTTSAHGS